MDSSGRHVLVKAVPESSKEWRIISALMSLNYDPENHTIPIVDVLHRDGTVFIVQAQWHDYPFSRPLNFHQWIVVAYQVLEGLAFMHRQGIGHGDLHIGNLVCNYHGEAAYSELKNSSFRIAFIGFGTSVQCRGETRTIPHQEFIAPPIPYRLPKQESGSDTDLFARDVYALGQIIRAIAPVTVGYRTPEGMLIYQFEVPSGSRLLRRSAQSNDVRGSEHTPLCASCTCSPDLCY
ncbi:hypothetical protein B0H11DRAFT_1803754 [Mycena galericulata]|nr:hypothetical protein B0H11DRAFT_1803754 [Mycena galericulata]